MKQVQISRGEKKKLQEAEEDIKRSLRPFYALCNFLHQLKLTACCKREGQGIRAGINISKMRLFVGKN